MNDLMFSGLAVLKKMISFLLGQESICHTVTISLSTILVEIGLFYPSAANYVCQYILPKSRKATARIPDRTMDITLIVSKG